MKLICLYIENFGGLSRYSLDFSEGLTVIQEDNGFGKTTLAEFIRTMLYGFPRKAKTLDKSKRQKYMSWNGGKCGGYLVFEYEGKCYRLERTFGATPKGDTFKLLDLDTNQKSDRFTENIGLELFGLDADSFERSTYMPQLRENGPMTTDSIQAKLGNLVEDTSDVNNFDRAVTALKNRRIGYQLYRGTGGSTAEAQSKISAIQRELDEVESCRGAMETSKNRTGELARMLEACNEELAEIRQRMTTASEAMAVRAAHGQYEDLQTSLQAVEQDRTLLLQRYPMGMPEPEVMDKAEDLADRIGMLSRQEISGQEERDALRYLEENRTRFEERLPEQVMLEKYRADCAEYRTLITEARSAGLSDGEKRQYEALLPVFQSGALEEKKLESLADKNRELIKYRHSRESLNLDAGDLRQLNVLEDWFSAGVPGVEELDIHFRGLTRMEELRQENGNLAAIRQTLPEKKKQNLLLPALMAAGSVVGIAGGVVLLVKSAYLAGGICLGTGVLLLIGAVFLGLRQMVSRELSGGLGIPQEIRERIASNDTQIAAIEAEIRSFTNRFGGEGSLSQRLHEIRKKREDLLALREKRRVLEERREMVDRQIRDLESELACALGTDKDFENAIVDLQLSRSRFLNLRAEKADADANATALLQRAEEICGRIVAFLKMYSSDVSQDMLEDQLLQLERDRDAYIRAAEAVARWEERKQQRAENLTAWNVELAEWFQNWGIICAEDPKEILRRIRKEHEQLQMLNRQVRKLAEDAAEFADAHTRELAMEKPGEPENMQMLQDKEFRILERIRELTCQELEEQQRGRELRMQVDRIPQLQDALDHWQQKRSEDLEKARVLDATVDFLQKAKESLSLSYLAPIRDSFAGYMQQLADEEPGKILVSPDLQVQLERCGEARELAYFSAGQTDLIMLCMRLALVDALFREAKPFVILDDPFVNLDDRSTARALELLKTLSEERQIIYLVCNSSRNF